MNLHLFVQLKKKLILQNQEIFGQFFMQIS